MDKKTLNLINLGALKCCLSGLTINSPADYSLEHYVPKSRAPEAITSNPYNLYPAIKILNTIKSDLLPCQWEVAKVERCYRALKNYHLKTREKQIVQAAIQIYESETPRNPCEMCILSLSQHYCDRARCR